MQAVIIEVQEWEALGRGTGCKGEVLFVENGKPIAHKYFSVLLPISIVDAIDVPCDFFDSIDVIKDAVKSRDPYGIYLQSLNGMEYKIAEYMEGIDADS